MAHSRRYELKASTCLVAPREKENREDNIAARVKLRKRLSAEGVPDMCDVEDEKLTLRVLDADGDQGARLSNQLPRKKESVRKNKK